MSNEPYGKVAKRLLMEAIEKDIRDTDQIFVTSFTKVSVNNIATLRKKLRDNKTKFRVVKNSLARRVFTDGKKEGLKELLEGKCALGISHGDVSVNAKILTDFAEDNPTFQIKGAYFDGNMYDLSRIKQFSKLPSRSELLGMVCGRMKSPIVGIVFVLSGLMRGLVNVLDQVKSQKEK